MKTISQKRKTDKKDKRHFFSRKTVLKTALLILLVISLLFYRDSLKSIMEGIRQITWKELWTGVLLALAGYLLEGLTIFCMMRTVVPYGRARSGIFIAFVCEFYRLTTMGNGSGIAEIHYLTQEKIEAGKAATLTMLQYVMKRTAIMLFGTFGFLLLLHNEKTENLCRKYLPFMAAGFLITLFVIALFLCLALSSKLACAALGLLDWLCGKMPYKKESFHKWGEQITLLNQSGKSILLHKKKMAGVVCLQTGKLLLFYCIPAYFLYGKITLTAGQCILLMAVAFMLAGVIPTPSGAVSLEFVFLLFFGGFADYQSVVLAIGLFRFATWICPAAVGGMMLAERRVFQTFK